MFSSCSSANVASTGLKVNFSLELDVFGLPIDWISTLVEGACEYIGVGEERIEGK